MNTNMNQSRAKAVERRWLKSNETPRYARLGFPSSGMPSCVHVNNRSVRDDVLHDMLHGHARAVANPSFFGAEEEIVIAETDRYGLPLRTVLSAGSGLMRSDPYYDENYLHDFYRQHYRPLYRPVRFSQPWFLTEQIKHGQRLLERHRSNLPRPARVLDVGCGMGGALVAFKFDGCTTLGCDWGEPYTARARSLGLDVRTGGLETVADEEPFDLIILSHVLEHVNDPIGFATQIGRLLTDDGILHIELPGILNIAAGYNGDVLEYLQSAHLWHFTQSTLTATLARAGLAVAQCDETITCIAQKGAVSNALDRTHGAVVLAELDRLEQAQTFRIAA